jgi:ATP-dependent 26S proteasome regulatory subunit
MQDQAELYDWIGDNVVEKSSDENHLYFDYATYGPNGFDTISLEIKKQSVDIETNYNDDLPNREILEFLASKESGLLILHGIPGTGKTSYIRHLMYTLFKREFLVLDNSVFNYITDSSFISLLMDYKDAVIILEDCESMLTDRTQGNNRLSALLNLSDGIIGDSFNFKFICTFNANIGKIDKALLRKGRMKLKYEFKELSAEKTKALAQKLGKDIKEDKPMTLANIYNYGHNNDRTDEERSIGFRK